MFVFHIFIYASLIIVITSSTILILHSHMYDIFWKITCDSYSMLKHSLAFTVTFLQRSSALQLFW